MVHLRWYWNGCRGNGLHQHCHIVKSVVHMVACMLLPLAVHHHSLRHPRNFHDLGTQPTAGQDHLGMPEWWPALWLIRSCWLREWLKLSRRILWDRIQQSLHSFHRLAPRRSWFPNLHVLLELAVLKAVGALQPDERPLGRRVLQRIRRPKSTYPAARAHTHGLLHLHQRIPPRIDQSSSSSSSLFPLSFCTRFSHDTTRRLSRHLYVCYHLYSCDPLGSSLRPSHLSFN